MGLRSLLVRRAVRATRVLVVECPDAWVTAVAVQRAVLARGWRPADSPATADVLLVAGEARGELGTVLERLWDAMPGPRARGEALDAGEVEAALDAAAGTLADGELQARDADTRDGTPPADGIPLAEGTQDDPDGLEMDALRVRLGPVLPAWPAGLVLDVTLHGDLVVAATARRVGDGPGGGRPADAAEAAARRCDDVSAVLTLAGWEGGARDARDARDVLLDRRGDDGMATLTDLHHRIERSRRLRWSLAGAGVVSADRAATLGAPAAVVGDCRDRLLTLVDRAEAAARTYRGTGRGATPPPVEPVSLEVLAGLVTGLDLGVARILVASLGSEALLADPHPVEAVPGA